MQKNEDPKIIVIDQEMFWRLVSLAEIGESECGEDGGVKVALKHVRKFNIPVAEKYYAKKEASRKKINELKKDTQIIFNKMIESEDEIFYKAEERYYPVRCVCISKNKTLIRVKFINVKPDFIGENADSYDVKASSLYLKNDLSGITKPAGFDYYILKESLKNADIKINSIKKLTKDFIDGCDSLQAKAKKGLITKKEADEAINSLSDSYNCSIKVIGIDESRNR